MNLKKALTKKMEGVAGNRSASASSIAIALIGGVAVGSLVSLLFAPQSGKDTRDMIAGKSRDLKDQLMNLKGKMQQSAESMAGNAKQKFNKMKQSSGDGVHQGSAMGI